MHEIQYFLKFAAWSQTLDFFEHWMFIWFSTHKLFLLPLIFSHDILTLDQIT